MPSLRDSVPFLAHPGLKSWAIFIASLRDWRSKVSLIARYCELGCRVQCSESAIYFFVDL